MSRIPTHTLPPVPETMLIPLLGRATESAKPDGILSDPRAQDIVSQLDYDFSRFYRCPSLWATCVRTRLMDGYLQSLLQLHPDATVVEIGCGLNTRYDRVQPSAGRWFDLDVPEVFQLWQQFFTETEERRFLPTSAYDLDWLDVVATSGQQPFIFLAEASLIYFDEAENQRLFEALARRFPGCYVIFDSVRASMIHQQGWHDALRYCQAQLRWNLDNIMELTGWAAGFRLLDRINFCLPPTPLRTLYPGPWLLQMAWLDWFRPDITRSYYVNYGQLGLA